MYTLEYGWSSHKYNIFYTLRMIGHVKASGQGYKVCRENYTCIYINNIWCLALVRQNCDIIARSRVPTLVIRNTWLLVLVRVCEARVETSVVFLSFYYFLLKNIIHTLLMFLLVWEDGGRVPASFTFSLCVFIEGKYILHTQKALRYKKIKYIASIHLNIYLYCHCMSVLYLLH